MKWIDIIIVVIFFLIAIYYFVELYPSTIGNVTPSAHKVSYHIFLKSFHYLKGLKAEFDTLFIQNKNLNE